MPLYPSAGAAAFCSGISATIASVVTRSAAIDAAFCSAVRVTFVGVVDACRYEALKFTPRRVVPEVLIFRCEDLATTTAP